MEKQLFDKKTTYFSLFILYAIVITAFEILICIYLEKSQEIQKNISLSNAQTHFQEIVNTRAWNAKFGGVFVKGVDDLKPNPYLKDNHLFDQEGSMLIKVNPAWMTRMLSEILSSDKFSFKITSLNPINPVNKPNSFELKALEYLEENRDEKEYYRFDDKSNNLQYVAGLLVTQACMKCHAAQGYKVGDIRGGISITLNAKESIETIQMLDIIKNISYLLYIIMLVSGALILYYVYKYNRMIYNQNRILDEKVRNRTRALEDAKNDAVMADKLKSNFLNNVSHELNTPLNSILATSELGIKEKSNTNSVMFTTIHDSANSLHMILSQILNFSKLERGEAKVESAPFNLQITIDELSNIFSQKSADKGLNFAVNISDTVKKTFIGDIDKTRQVLFNILDNAVKFTNKGDVNFDISLLNKTKDRYEIVFCIEDTGIGIPIEEHQNILKTIGQLDSNKNRQFEGIGVGLYVCKNIIDILGGQLKIESCESSKGTKVTIILPLEISKEQLKEEDLVEGVTKQKEESHLDVDKAKEIMKKILDDMENDYAEVLESVIEFKRLTYATSIEKEVNGICNKLSNFDSDGAKIEIEKLLAIIEQDKESK